MKHTLTGVIASSVALVPGCRSKELPEWFDLMEYEVTVSLLGKAFDGFRVLHLTDIHSSEWMDAQRLAALKTYTLAQEVDLIAVTGDSTYHTTDFQPLLAFYSGLEANAPVIMTWGNHDIWDRADIGLAPIIGKHATLMNNDRFVIERGNDLLCIAGLDCAYEERDDLAAVIDEFPADAPALMLAHEPDIAPVVAATGKFFLQISGHSHGGQICLPNGYAPIFPWLGQKYPRGFYEVDGMMLYTSRGIGRGKPFLRTFCPAEAVIYTLRSGEKNQFQETQS